MAGMHAERRGIYLHEIPEAHRTPAQVSMLGKLTGDDQVESLISRVSDQVRESFFDSLSEKERRTCEGKMVVAMRPEQRRIYINSFDAEMRPTKQASMLVALPVLERSKHLKTLPPGERTLVEGIMLAWLESDEEKSAYLHVLFPEQREGAIRIMLIHMDPEARSAFLDNLPAMERERTLAGMLATMSEDQRANYLLVGMTAKQREHYFQEQNTTLNSLLFDLSFNSLVSVKHTEFTAATEGKRRRRNAFTHVPRWLSLFNPSVASGCSQKAHPESSLTPDSSRTRESSLYESTFTTTTRCHRGRDARRGQSNGKRFHRLLPLL